MKNRTRAIFAKLSALALLAACTHDMEEPMAVDQELVVQSNRCRVEYVVGSEWGSGFGANVTVTNRGAAVSSWKLEWQFNSGQRVTSLWNGSVTQSGGAVTVTDAGWNASLPTNASVSFGFNGSLSGFNGAPSGFKLNGVSCEGQSSGSGGGTSTGGTSSGGGSSTGGRSSGGSGGTATGGTGGTATGGTGGTGGGGNLVWRRANATNYTSYPDPGSEECIEYNGCTWAGYFAALNGQQSEEWVRNNNIIAMFSAHDGNAAYNTHKLKKIRLRKNGREIDVTVYDTCGDSDCSGCCTRNATRNGLTTLIDLEKYTYQRFGQGDGILEWACLNCN